APWWILTSHGGTATVAAWEAVPVIAAGAALYAWCVWNFAAVGDGTPGLWDAPRRVVVTGPYRWVRNPIYLAALLVVLGEAWLFSRMRSLVSAGAMASSPPFSAPAKGRGGPPPRSGVSSLEPGRPPPRGPPPPPRHG